MTSIRFDLSVQKSQTRRDKFCMKGFSGTLEMAINHLTLKQEICGVKSDRMVTLKSRLSSRSFETVMHVLLFEPSPNLASIRFAENHIFCCLSLIRLSKNNLKTTGLLGWKAKKIS